MRVLIIEDEERIGQNIKKVLEMGHFQADIAINGKDGLEKAEIEDYDVIVIDWMLPDMEGVRICEYLKRKDIPTPLLMLTAKSQLEDKLEGFEKGADDYLTKPFAMEELIIRIKALIRRKSGIPQSPFIRVADLMIDTNTCTVKRNNRPILLAPKEYALLEYMARNKCKVINRLDLLSHVWGEDIDQFSNTVDVHIRYLRKKVDDPYQKKLIKTVVEKGYMLCDA